VFIVAPVTQGRRAGLTYSLALKTFSMQQQTINY